MHNQGNRGGCMKEWKNGRPWAAAARAALVMVLASACVLAGSAQAAGAVPDSGSAEGGRMLNLRNGGG